jgi:hypothetical protein
LKKHLWLNVAGAALGMTIAAGAYAQPPVSMQVSCKMMPCIYDSRDTLVGIPWSYGFAARQISKTWYQIANVRDDGIQELLQYYYPNDTCSGQPYMPIDVFVPPLAQYDGTSIWAPIGAAVTFTWKCILTVAAPGVPDNTKYVDPYCGSPGYPCTFTGAPAAKVETRAFYPPLKVQ